MLRVRNYSDDNDDARILIDPVLISLKLKPGDEARCSFGHVYMNCHGSEFDRGVFLRTVYNLSEIKSLEERFAWLDRSLPCIIIENKKAPT